jgi:hypothetical protein
MNFFNSEERRQRRELERKMKVRQSKRTVEQHIQRQKKNIERYLGLGKRAARLNDEGMFRQIATAILASQRDVMQWERRLLYFDMVEARTEQIRAAAEFAKAYQNMAQSMLENSNPANIAKIQQDIQMGLSRAEMMDDMLANLVDISDEMLADFAGGEQEKELAQLMASIRSEATQESGSGAADAEIEAGLRAIEEKLGKL